jgi:hypothetical protein
LPPANQAPGNACSCPAPVFNSRSVGDLENSVTKQAKGSTLSGMFNASSMMEITSLLTNDEQKSLIFYFKIVENKINRKIGNMYLLMGVKILINLLHKFTVKIFFYP